MAYKYFSYKTSGGEKFKIEYADQLTCLGGGAESWFVVLKDNKKIAEFHVKISGTLRSPAYWDLRDDKKALVAIQNLGLLKIKHMLEREMLKERHKLVFATNNSERSLEKEEERLKKNLEKPKIPPKPLSKKSLSLRLTLPFIL